MAYRLFLVSKRNKIEKTERVIPASTASDALDRAAVTLTDWNVVEVMPCAM
jgi:hypothetical protein